MSAELTLERTARIIADYRELVDQKRYKHLPLGQDVDAYLRAKKRRLTDTSYKAYRLTLTRFAEHFGDLRVEDFEPPVGTERVEEFMDRHWGDKSARTYNRNLSILTDFFKHFRDRNQMLGDPTSAVNRAKAREVHREIFSGDARRAVIAAQSDVRDRIALRLLFDYGLRRGSLQKVRFQHFDHVRKRLTLFLKGGKVREKPIPDPAFWHDLERLILDSAAEGHHFLLQREVANRHARRRVPDEPMGHHGLHKWWYRCLERAGLVGEGVTSGERMHKARHTAGQRILDHTGNLKAVQVFLDHESIQTTADTYLGWTDEQQAATLLSVFEADDG